MLATSSSASLVRTSSVASVGSDDSATAIDSIPSLAGDTPPEGAVRRTRKRFTSVQLMMLEHLYRNATHPTREQREQLAKEAEM